MRHTAATLMLASGENPEWIAATLGHTSTEMLFRVYSRFVPNLTRNDGRAYSGMLEETMDRKVGSTAPATNNKTFMAGLTREQKIALMASLATELSAS